MLPHHPHTSPTLSQVPAKTDYLMALTKELNDSDLQSIIPSNFHGST
jgi:hypothetical protein